MSLACHGERWHPKKAGGVMSWDLRAADACPTPTTLHGIGVARKTEHSPPSREKKKVLVSHGRSEGRWRRLLMAARMALLLTIISKA